MDLVICSSAIQLIPPKIIENGTIKIQLKHLLDVAQFTVYTISTKFFFD